MPLDPKVQEYLKTMVDAQMPPLSELAVDDARALMEISVKQLGVPEEVKSLADHYVAVGEDQQIRVRRYTPQPVSPSSRIPQSALLYFHGGGWVLGSIESHDIYCRALANAAQTNVFSVAYRLAPEHRFPIPPEDCYAAVCWAREQASELQIDPTKIMVGGDSAGGNLAAVTTLMARDRSHLKLAGQLLIYPITNYAFDTTSYLENADGYQLTRAEMQWFWSQYLARDQDGFQDYASPLRSVNLKGLPPTLIITAQYDPLRDEGEAFAERLRETGCDIQCTRYDGMIHGFARRFNLFPQGRQALQEAAEFMKRCA